MSDEELRDAVVHAGRSLFWRGLTPGASGNISVRSDNGWLATPTHSCLGELQAGQLAQIAPDATHMNGPAPTMELALHLRMYELHPEIDAVVHLHSALAVAVSIVDGLDPTDALPRLTPYQIMRVGRLPIIPYARPGSLELANLLTQHLGDARCALLANHGSISGATNLDLATEAAEEIEQTARIWMLLDGRGIHTISSTLANELRVRNHVARDEPAPRRSTT